MIRAWKVRITLPTTLAVLLGAMLVAGTSRAQQPVTYYGFTFPTSIAGAELGSTHDFESRHPGLGYSVRYKLPGWNIDVYIYDLGRTSIPDEATSEPVEGQLADATKDVFRRPRTSNVEAKLRYEIRDENARVRFLCTAFAFLQGQTQVDSYLCVTSWQSKFVKFRLSTAHRAGSESVANGFVQAWMKVLWPS